MNNSLLTLCAATLVLAAAAPLPALTTVAISPDNTFAEITTRNITIMFGAAVDPATVNTSTVKITRNGYAGYTRSGTDVAGVWTHTADNLTFTFNPAYAFNLGDLVVTRVLAGTNGPKDSGGSPVSPSESMAAFMVRPSATPPYTSTTAADVTLGTGTFNVLTIRSQYATGQTNKVLFWVHGGGWGDTNTSYNVATGVTTSVGEKPMYAFADYLCTYFKLAIIGVPYRNFRAGDQSNPNSSNGFGIFDNGLADTLKVYDYVRAHPGDFSVTTAPQDSDFGFYGSSAGTPLASLAALNKHAACFVGYNGIYDFDMAAVGSTFPDNPTDGGSAHASPRVRYAVGAGGTLEAQQHSAIISYAAALSTGNIPKILVLHGTGDATIPHQRSLDFFAEASTQQWPNRIGILPGVPHGLYAPAQHVQAVVLWETVAFLKAIGFVTAP